MAKEKKKKWIKVYAPKVLNEVELPEILVDDPKSAVGRTITLNLMFVTNSVRDRDYSIKFEIIECSEDKCKTQVRRINLLPSSVKKRVRKRKDRIDDSFVVATSDNKLVRIKPIILTARNSSNRRQSFLRKAVKFLLWKEIKGKTYDELMKEVLSKSLTKKLFDTLNLYHPISFFDIRVIELVRNKLVKQVTENDFVNFELPEQKKKVQN